MTLWEDVDVRVLRWVFSLPPSFENQEVYDFPTRHPEPFDFIDGLDTLAVTKSLRRLRGHGLIEGRTGGWLEGEQWNTLRVTSRGLVCLGEWPDLELVATGSAIHHLLNAAAGDASEEGQQRALRRAAGVLGRTADAVVRDTLSEVAHSARGEATE